MLLLPIITYFGTKVFKYLDEKENRNGGYLCSKCNFPLRAKPSNCCSLISHWEIYSNELVRQKDEMIYLYQQKIERDNDDHQEIIRQKDQTIYFYQQKIERDNND